MRFLRLSVVVLAAFAGSLGQAQPDRPGAPLITGVPGSAPPLGRLPVTLATERVDVLGGSVETAELVASLVEEAVAALPARFANPDLRTQVVIRGADSGPCPVRAFAGYREGRASIGINLDLGWSVGTLRRIVAHEVGHVYHFAARGAVEGLSSDGILNEGLATWLSAPFWLADLGAESFESLIRSNMERGVYFGLVEDYEVDLSARAASGRECVELRDALYTQWAGFVGFLIDKYGVEAVLSATRLPAELVEVGRGEWRRGSQLDYVAAFGASLADLENEWLRRLAEE